VNGAALADRGESAELRLCWKPLGCGWRGVNEGDSTLSLVGGGALERSDDNRDYMKAVPIGRYCGSHGAGCFVVIHTAFVFEPAKSVYINVSARRALIIFWKVSDHKAKCCHGDTPRPFGRGDGTALRASGAFAPRRAAMGSGLELNHRDNVVGGLDRDGGSGSGDASHVNAQPRHWYHGPSDSREYQAADCGLRKRHEDWRLRGRIAMLSGPVAREQKWRVTSDGGAWRQRR
jgi:hypothetical protein